MEESAVHRAGLFAENLGDLFAGITLLDVFPFVVALAPSAQTDLELGQPLFVDKKLETDNTQPLVLQGALQFEQLFAREQQFAIPFGHVVVVGPPMILGNVHAADKQLSVVEIAVAVRQ